MSLASTWRDPRDVIAMLAAELSHVHGLRHLYINADSHIALLSACTGVTIWYLPRHCGRVLTWAEDGQQITWPAADPQGAATRITARCRALAQARQQPQLPRNTHGSA